MSILTILLLAVATEAVAEIVTSSSLTQPVRNWLSTKAFPVDSPPSNTFIQHFIVFISKLVSCGYCASVWIGAFFALWAPLLIDAFVLRALEAPSAIVIVVNWLCLAFLIHRLSNWLHVVYELVRKGRVKTYDLSVIVKYDEE